MCTSISWKNGDHYFGRNLDLEVAFGQQVVITPRKYPFSFRSGETLAEHYAMIGMATVMEGFPLYAEAVNEKGLCIAGLNFPGNAYYPTEGAGEKHAVSPFELPWWLLGQCATVQEAHALLEDTQLVSIPFSEQIQLSPLHWHIADAKESIVVECMKEGMHIHRDPVGVLTNNPPFDFHLYNLSQYMNLSADLPENQFSDEVELRPFGRGFGAFGLPGDASPASRFVRAAFLKLNAECEQTEDASVAQFMHILDAVAMTKGSVNTPAGKWDHTLYSCCVNTDRGIYYYKTYGNNQLTAVHLHHAELDGQALTCFPLEMRQQICHAN